MDLIATLIVAGTIFTANTPEVLSPEQTAEIKTNKVDQMTTGTLQQPDRRAWNELRSAYELCPKCVDTQPFPEGDLPDE
ncbi:MAG: hypothetical protein AAGF29_02430 [Pseudomonadota bacterium]